MTCSTVLVTAAPCALALGAPVSASAHAILVQSQPAPGVELSSSPAQITATFSEPLNPQLSNLTVIGPGGSAYPRDAARWANRAEHHRLPAVGARSLRLHIQPWLAAARRDRHHRLEGVGALRGKAQLGTSQYGRRHVRRQ